MLDTRVGPSALDYVIVTLRGELDLASAPATARILRAAVAPHLRIIVDLTEVTFIDCSGVAELLSARAQVEQAGGALLLTGLHPRVRRILSLLKLTGALPIFASAQEAINGNQEAS